MKLLVSVVSAEEARAAVRGGADIVDVKDPLEGALGAPAPHVLAEVVAAVDGAVPVSVALGDLPPLPHTAALAAAAAATAGASFVKAGLRGMADVASATALMRAIRAAVDPAVGVIAAAYADAAALHPPAMPPSSLPAVVAAAGIEGALVDTCVKDGRGLYAWLSPADVAELIERTRAAGGTFGVAGQLTLHDLATVDADLVGVRSAVCGGDRTATLDAGLVAAAAQAIRLPVPPGARTVTATPVRRIASGR